MMPHDVTQADLEAADKWYDRDFPGHRGLSKLLAAHRIAAIAEERARVVAWLRDNATEPQGPSWLLGAAPTFSMLADLIERGDHIQEM